MRKEVGAPRAARLKIKGHAGFTISGSSKADSSGFTIIEVILFLAISGALAVALLATFGGSISRQRFRDSIISTQAFVQSQYHETLNVVNNRQAASCSSGSGSTTSGDGSVVRGASACVVLGRALVFARDSAQVTMYSVLGTEPIIPPTTTGPELLKEYKPGIDTSSAQTYTIPWGEKISSINPSTSTNILLLRSPDTGLVLTFGGGTDLQNTISAGTHSVNLCIKTQDLLGTAAVVSLSPVSGSEGVTTQFDLDGEDQGRLC